MDGSEIGRQLAARVNRGHWFECAGCGALFQARKFGKKYAARARYCSDGCGQRARRAKTREKLVEKPIDNVMA